MKKHLLISLCTLALSTQNIKAQYLEVFNDEYNSADVRTWSEGIVMDNDNNSYHFYGDFTNSENSLRVKKHSMTGTLEWTKVLEMSSNNFNSSDIYNNEVYFVSSNNFQEIIFNSLNKANGDVDSLFSLSTLYGYYLNVSLLKVGSQGFVIGGNATTDGYNNKSFVALFDFQGNIVWSRFDLGDNITGNNTLTQQIEIKNNNLIVHIIGENTPYVINGSPNGGSYQYSGFRVLDINDGSDLFIASDDKKDYSPICYALDDDNNLYFSSVFWSGNFQYSSIEKVDLNTYNSEFLDSIFMREHNQDGDTKISHLTFHDAHLYAHGTRSGQTYYDAKLYKINLDGSLEHSVPFQLQRGFNILGDGSELLIIYENEDSKQSIATYDNDLNLLNQESHTKNGYFAYGDALHFSNSGCFAFCGTFYPVAGSNFNIANIYHYCTATAGLTEELEELSSYTLYPNPSSSKVHIDFLSPLTTNTTIEVISLEGRSVVMKNIPANTLSTSFSVEELTSGTYLVRIGSEVKKLIVE